MANPFQPGLDGRHRDDDGTAHKKRRDSLVKNLRKIYPNFAPDRRADATLGRILDDADVDTLDQYFKENPGEKW